MEFDKIPKELVRDGRFNNGVYNEVFEKLNPLDANVFSKRISPRCINNISLKEWHAYQFGDEKFFCLLIVMNMKKTAMFELVIYDIERKSFYKYLVTKPMIELEIGKNVLDSKVFYRDESTLLEISNRLQNNSININLSCRLKSGTSIKLNVGGDASTTKPIVSCMPISKNRSIYTHKQPMQMQGTLLINREVHKFENNSFLILDDQKSYYSRNFWWNWISSAKIIDGQMFAFNLTENQSLNPKKYNENCVWYRNKEYRLPAVKFLFDRKNMLWKIVDENGQVDITFKVEFKNSINRNLMIFKSDYYAPFGWAEGTLKFEGITLNVKDFFAMGEKINIKL